MKTSKILAAATLALLAAAGAHAETYDGVLTITSYRPRAESKAEAVVAAHSADPYAEGASAGPAPRLTSLLARGNVRADAVAAAHGPDRYADSYDQGVTPRRDGAVQRTAIRAEAHTAARTAN